MYKGNLINIYKQVGQELRVTVERAGYIQTGSLAVGCPCGGECTVNAEMFAVD